MRYSHPLWTLPIGIQTNSFLNCVVLGQCEMEYEALRTQTKEIEQKCGNTAERRKNGEIAMDIDILLFGDKKYHRQDWKRQYIRDGMEELHLGSSESKVKPV